MKKIKLLSVLAMSLLAFAFTSCNTGDSDGFQWPTLRSPRLSSARFRACTMVESSSLAA